MSQIASTSQPSNSVPTTGINKLFLVPLTILSDIPKGFLKFYSTCVYEQRQYTEISESDKDVLNSIKKEAQESYNTLGNVGTTSEQSAQTAHTAQQEGYRYWKKRMEALSNGSVQISIANFSLSQKIIKATLSTNAQPQIMSDKGVVKALFGPGGQYICEYQPASDTSEARYTVTPKRTVLMSVFTLKRFDANCLVCHAYETKDLESPPQLTLQESNTVDSILHDYKRVKTHIRYTDHKEATSVQKEIYSAMERTIDESNYTAELIIRMAEPAETYEIAKRWDTIDFDALKVQPGETMEMIFGHDANSSCLVRAPQRDTPASFGESRTELPQSHAGQSA